MKHFKYLFLFIGLALFASCSESDVEGGVIAGKNQAQFSGVVKELQTRVTGTSWDKDDEIGVYALRADQDVVYDNMANVQYKTSKGDGVFAPTGPAIRFPDDGGNLDFVAYYPYDSKVTDLEYTVERGTDLLYSNNATGQNKETPEVSLEFKHALSKLVLNIGLSDNLQSLEGLTATINNVSTTGKVNLVEGDITVYAAGSITPTVVLAEENKKATITELVMPTQDLQNAEVVFTLGGNTYKWSPAEETILVANMQYVYKFNLKLEAGELVVVEVGTATIGDWETGHEDEGFTDLDPEVDGVGKGTKENPYTVAQAIDKQGEKDVWVKGFIVGSFNNGSIYGTENASEFNINIADNKDETTDSKVVNVQLTTTNNIRVNLNLIKNSEMYKAEVLFRGDLVKYNNLPGIKSTKEYEIVTEGETDPTPKPIEFTTDKSAVVLNADADLTSTVKLTTDAAQAWTVTSDAAWLTVAPVSGSGNADIVLTAAENTAEAVRTATVTINPTANEDLTPIVVDVTQAGTVAPPTELLFPGSDFNDWATFISSLNKYGVTFGKESATGGREASGAMHFEGSHGSNAYVFTAVVPEGFSAAGKTKINFWVKGIAAKSLSMNVYVGDGGTMGTDYKCYNMDEHVPYDSHQVLEPAEANSYAKGGIDSGGEWIQVSLDISTLDINTTPGQNLFALKVGSKSDYNLFVDDITIE